MLPRLPGHGTSWQELNQTTWEDWYACVGRASPICGPSVTRCSSPGLSMGGALALRLAEQHGARSPDWRWSIR